MLAGRIVVRMSTLPCVLAGGSLLVDGQTVENVLTVPSSHAGQVQLRLEGAQGEQLVVEGQGIQLVMLDKPEYREEFGGAGAAGRT